MRFIMPAFAMLLSTCLVTACGNTDSGQQQAEQSESSEESDLSDQTTVQAETTSAIPETTTTAAQTTTAAESTTLAAVTAVQTAPPQTDPPQTDPPATPQVERIVEYVEVPVQQEQPQVQQEQPAQQPQQDNGWRDAFANVLRVNSDYRSFSLCNVDDNDIPELVLHRPRTSEYSHHADTDVRVFVYANGNAHDLGTYSYDGNSNFAYYPRTGILLDGFSSTGYTIVNYNRLSGTTITKEHSFEDDFAAGGTSAKIDGAESGLSSDAFYAREREMYLGQVTSDCGSYDNEEYNIQRYLYG